MRLMIAIPCADTIRYEFAESLSKLEIQLAEDGIDFDVKWLAGSLIYMAREDLAFAATNGGYSHILWLDSDMQFTRDLFNILYGVGKPFVTGIYRSRRSPYAYALFSDNERAQRVLKLEDEPFEIQSCGFGCVLMRKDVLWNVMIQQNQDGLLFSPIKGVGEDLSFCWRARKSGYKIMCDPTIALGHEIRTVITKSNRGIFNGNVVKTQA